MGTNIKLRQYCKNMVKNIRLYVLVIAPFGGVGKGVDLYGEPIFSRL